MLPTPLVDRVREARVILEIGAGARFETALAMRAANPSARIVASDIDARVLAAPPDIEARLVDVLHADLVALGDVDLVVAVRLPEELQLAAVGLARALHADLAIRALKDEWADLGPTRVVVWPDGWRYVASSERRGS